ncbi:unnamed protein product, partial [Prorocentrum cordatum]
MLQMRLARTRALEAEAGKGNMAQQECLHIVEDQLAAINGVFHGLQSCSGLIGAKTREIDEPVWEAGDPGAWTRCGCQRKDECWWVDCSNEAEDSADEIAMKIGMLEERLAKLDGAQE